MGIGGNRDSRQPRHGLTQCLNPLSETTAKISASSIKKFSDPLFCFSAVSLWQLRAPGRHAGCSDLLDTPIKQPLKGQKRVFELGANRDQILLSEDLASPELFDSLFYVARARTHNKSTLLLPCAVLHETSENQPKMTVFGTKTAPDDN